MDGNMMEPKGFKIEIRTVARAGSGETALNASIADICEQVKNILKNYSTFDGNQQLAVTIHTCDTGYEVEDSLVNLVPGTVSMDKDADYIRNYWIGEAR